MSDPGRWTSRQKDTTWISRPSSVRVSTGRDEVAQQERVPDAGVLIKESAYRMSNKEESDIDQVVPRFEKAMQPYRMSKALPDRVTETLAQYLEGDGPHAGDGRPEVQEDGLGSLSPVSSPRQDGNRDVLPF
jgi:PHD/YefM family antitoxin component YafN of YafNO toxin-antitoxin module